jgi:hypothetical protein
MSGLSIAQKAINAGFRIHGFAALYVPTTGAPQGITLLKAMPDVDIALSTAKARDQKRLFKVRVSEVTQPARDAAIALDGENLPIRDFYHSADDPFRLIWTIECGAAQ